MIKLFTKYLALFFIGGTIYVSIEHIWRGWSHWTMFILGGICFIALGLINEILDWDTPMILQMAIGCVIITTLEFITGCVVNLGLGWDVWDYSQYPLNFLGQISVRSSVLWYFLSAVGIVLDDTIRWKVFGEDKPKYKWI
jgi:uncharacterized membrane protein